MGIKKTILLIILVVLLSGCSYGQKMDKQDLIFEGAYQACHWIDWHQTRNLNYDGGYYELNPILGKYPTNSEVDRYFIITGAGHALITRLLPPKYRKYWLSLTITIEGFVVIRNEFN